MEILKILGYPASSILLLAIIAYLGRQLFEKILNSVVSRDLEALKSQNSEALEKIKNDYNLILEDKKAELVKETERLKATFSVEAEIYKMAAQKRFEYLLSLWESSESLFEETDFSNRDSINTALEKVDKSIAILNKYSVLFPPSVAERIRLYLNQVAKILTNSEKNFRENAVTTDKIANFLNDLAGATSFFSSHLSLVASFGAEIVPSIGKHLEEFRYKSAIEARKNLEEILRDEFGVWVSERKQLENSITIA